MLERQLPTVEGGEDWSEEDCREAIREGLRRLQTIIYQQVFKDGSVPPRALRDFVVAAQALGVALDRGDGPFLRDAARAAGTHLEELQKQWKVGKGSGSIPGELLETRSSTLEQILVWVEPAFARALEQQPTARGEAIEEVAMRVVDIVVNDPIVVLPFRVAAKPTRLNADPALMHQDYFSEARRNAATIAARRAIEAAKPGDAVRATAMAAVDEALAELGVSGKPFDFLRKRDARAKERKEAETGKMARATKKKTPQRRS